MNKCISLISSLFAAVCATGQSLDIQHYRFAIELNDRNDTIYGKADITVKFLKPANTVEFDLIQAKNSGKGMWVVDTRGPKTKGHGPDPTREKCIIHLTEVFKEGDTATFTIIYKGVPADGLIISKNIYGQRTFFADNWPNRGRNWLPCIDQPADKASVEFIVTAPQKYQVVANGIRVEKTGSSPTAATGKKTTHWKEEVPISTKVMVIGVAEFAVDLAGMVDNRIPVYSWVYPQHKEQGFYDYGQALDILPFFIKNIGPYPYKKLANVESKTIFGGLENANTIFYSESSITGNRSAERLITHEIAHQWFGNMATEKSFAHLWLSEGFATYMTILYMENKYGKDTAQKMLVKDREEVIDHAKISQRPVVDNTTDYMQLLNANSYQKGSWILHMLRSQSGDSVFWKGIRKYYATYAGKTADTDDFRKIMEEVSGRDLNGFFQQWLFRPGIPELNISWRYNTTEQQVELTIEQVQKNNLFQFPLELGFALPDGKMFYYELRVRESKENHTIPLKEKPLSVVADPGLKLLFEGRVKPL